MSRLSSIVPANRRHLRPARSFAHRPRALLGATLGVLAALGFAQPAFAESCAYDAGTRTVTASITAGGEATLVVSGGELWFGATPAACGAATTPNTNSITITGGAGSLEQLTLDNRGGVFGPGQAAESNIPGDRDRHRARRRHRQGRRLRDPGQRFHGGRPERTRREHRRRRRRHVLARCLPARGAPARRQRLLQRTWPGRRRPALPRADRAHGWGR